MKVLLLKRFKILKTPVADVIEKLNLMVDSTQLIIESMQSSQSLTGYSAVICLMEQCSRALFGNVKQSKLQSREQRPFGLWQESFEDMTLTESGIFQSLEYMEFLDGFLVKELQADIFRTALVLLLVSFCLEKKYQTLNSHNEFRNLFVSLMGKVISDDNKADELSCNVANEMNLSFVEFLEVYSKRWRRSKERCFIVEIIRLCINNHQKEFENLLKNWSIQCQCLFKGVNYIFSGTTQSSRFYKLKQWMNEHTINDFKRLVFELKNQMNEENDENIESSFIKISLAEILRLIVKKAKMRYGVAVEYIVYDDDILSRFLFCPIVIYKSKKESSLHTCYTILQTEDIMIKYLTLAAMSYVKCGIFDQLLKRDKDNFSKYLPAKLTVGILLYYTGIFLTKPRLSLNSFKIVPYRCDIVEVLPIQERPNFHLKWDENKTDDIKEREKEEEDTYYSTVELSIKNARRKRNRDKSENESSLGRKPENIFSCEVSSIKSLPEIFDNSGDNVVFHKEDSLLSETNSFLPAEDKTNFNSIKAGEDNTIIKTGYLKIGLC